MTPDALVTVVRRTLDRPLARGGFTWNESGVQGDPPTFLYEADTRDAARRVPHLLSAVGDPDGPCLDLWFLGSRQLDRIVSVTLEGVDVVDLLVRYGHHQAAAHVAEAQTLAAQLDAYAAAFDVLFGAGPAVPDPG